MSERRDPGYYVVRVRKEREDLHIGEVIGSTTYFADSSGWPVDQVAEWGPKILPDPNLVQVPKEELEALRELERVVRRGPYQNQAMKGELELLDSLRRREGESDGS